MTRKAIGLATITIYVKHYQDDDGIEHIDIEQTAGPISSTESRTLIWEPKEVEDRLFGSVSESRQNTYIHLSRMADTMS